MNNNKRISSFQRSSGYTLMELSLVIGLLIAISFAFYYGARFSHAELKLFIGKKQAQSLVNNVNVDYQLVKARHNSGVLITDFFGYLYTQNWPQEEHGLFTASDAVELPSKLNKLDNGCLDIQSVFIPCLSDDEGLYLSYHNQIFRPNLSRSQQKTMLGTDMKTVQNFYFQQTSSYTGVMGSNNSDANAHSGVSEAAANAVESNFDASFDLVTSPTQSQSQSQ